MNIPILKKSALILLLVTAASFANAQTGLHTLKLNKGDEYQKITLIRSNSSLQRGKQKLNISSFSSITKTYIVTGADEHGYTLTIITKHIADTLDAMGSKLLYNSDKPIDPNSAIEKALNSMIGKLVTISIDKHGIITEVNDPAEQITGDTVMTLTGLQPERFIKGKALGLVTDFNPAKPLQKGYTWADSSAVDKEKTKNTFAVNNITGRATTIAFKSQYTKDFTASGTNGLYVVDNNTGIVLQRTMKSLTSGYQVRGKQIVGISRSSNLSERCYKLL